MIARTIPNKTRKCVNIKSNVPVHVIGHTYSTDWCHINITDATGNEKTLNIDKSICPGIIKLIETWHPTRSSCSGLPEEHDRTKYDWSELLLLQPTITFDVTNLPLYKSCLTNVAHKLKLTTNEISVKKSQGLTISVVDDDINITKKKKTLPKEMQPSKKWNPMNTFADEVVCNCSDFLPKINHQKIHEYCNREL